MSDILLTDVINGLAALILLFAFVLVAGVRMGQIVRAYTLGSLALGLLAAAVAYYTHADHIYVVAVLTIVLKVVVIPRFLNYTVDRIKVKKEVEPLVSIPGSLLICGALTFVAYYIASPIIAQGDIDSGRVHRFLRDHRPAQGHDGDSRPAHDGERPVPGSDLAYLWNAHDRRDRRVLRCAGGSHHHGDIRLQDQPYVRDP